MILNEELQKFVLLLMGLIRRAVKHIDNPSHSAKVIRKVSKKRFGKLNIDVTKIAFEPIALNFIASVREIMTNTRHWNTETEASYYTLIRYGHCILAHCTGWCRRTIRPIQKCRKVSGLGCVNCTRARVQVTQRSPCIFLHVCKVFQHVCNTMGQRPLVKKEIVHEIVPAWADPCS